MIFLLNQAVEFEPSFPGSTSVSSWATSGSGTGEDVQSKPPIHLPFVPGYFSPESPTRTLVRYEDIYSILFEHPPHKLVSVGPNHQADVPLWDSAATCSSSRPNASDAVGDNKVEERLMGTCIMPMPQMELSICENEEIVKGRIDCSCEDKGSVRCVRQHIVEAREELMKNIGHEIFADLGLSDMGEQVADKWSAEEEQLFCEVVFNSPATLDKTFWNYLSIAFPLKTKKELVSYYFNVFMLRRRAEQNRNDPLAIDSDDDDEWQGSDGNGIRQMKFMLLSPLCIKMMLVLLIAMKMICKTMMSMPQMKLVLLIGTLMEIQNTILQRCLTSLVYLLLISNPRIKLFGKRGLMKKFKMIQAHHVKQELPHRRPRCRAGMVITGVVITLRNATVIAKDMFWSLVMLKSGILALSCTRSNIDFLRAFKHMFKDVLADGRRK